MAKTSPSPAPTTFATRWRKVARRAGLVAIGLFVLLAAVFFLLPVWISNEQGRLYVLDRLNDHLHGPKVAVDSWSLGWFRNTQLTNLRIMQPDGTLLLTCPHVSSGLTLWDIFWGQYHIGNTTADNLELRLARNADGTTSLDSFAAGAGEILRSAQGALQINNGTMTIVSVKTGQSARYVDVKAAINVASPDAPFHVQLSAVGTADSTFSLKATFPPPHTLSMNSFSHPSVWQLVTDIDFAANRLPSGLACDYLGVNGAWADSFGDTLDTVQFSGHALPAQDNIRLALFIRGTGKSGETPTLDSRLLFRAPALDGTGAFLYLPTPSTDYRLNAALRFSPPLAKLLGHLNPLLAEASAVPGGGGGTNTGLLRATASAFSLPLDSPADAQASARLTFPPMQFTARDGPSMVRQLQVLTGDLPRPTTTARTEGSAEVLLVRLAQGQFSYDNFRVALGKRRITFTGTVNLDGKIDLLAAIPDASPGLSAGTAIVAIKGTIDSPLLQRAE